MNPFVLLWRSGRDVFDELFLMMGVNIVWLVMCGPLFALALFFASSGQPVIALLLCLLNILPFGPATAALFAVAERVTEGRSASMRLFFESMRTYARDSWKLYGMWIVGLVGLAVNLWFYPQLSPGLGAFITVLFLYLSLIWVALLIYLGPLLVLQPDRRIRLMWRNAAVMAFGRPFFTLITAVLMAIILVVSIWVFLIALLLTFAFLAVWGMRVTQAVIAASEARREARQAKASSSSNDDERGPRGQVRPRDPE